MTLRSMRYNAFAGLWQGRPDSALGVSYSPDACNVETRGGILRRMKGFSFLLEASAPTPEALRRLYVWEREEGARYLCCCEAGVYACAGEGQPFSQLHAFTDTGRAPADYAFLTVRIGDAERLLIAAKGEPIEAWDGTSSATSAFGSQAQGSDKGVSSLALRGGRLFAAGDPDAPCRLYYSAVPGGERSLADWTADAQSENAGGGYVDVGVPSEPITGLFALCDQLVILKENSLWRLYGDRPAGFRVTRLETPLPKTVRGACALYNERLYLLTNTGLVCYDGQSLVQSAGGEALRPLLTNASLQFAASAAFDGRLYMALNLGTGLYNDRVIEYDLRRDLFLLRSGFRCVDLIAGAERLYLLTGTGEVCAFDDGDTYDGEPISAYWTTGYLDADSFFLQLQALRAAFVGQGGTMRLSVETDGVWRDFLMELPTKTALRELPLAVPMGRRLRLRLSNVDGSDFVLSDGMELALNVAVKRV